MESESHGDRCKGHSGSKLDAGWVLRGQRAEVTWLHMESADEDTCCRPEDVGRHRVRVRGPHVWRRPVAVTGRPNQVLSIPGVATLILNESRHDPDGDCDDDDSEHRALHLILANGEEVILASSKFDSDDGLLLRLADAAVHLGGAQVPLSVRLRPRWHAGFSADHALHHEPEHVRARLVLDQERQVHPERLARVGGRARVLGQERAAKAAVSGEAPGSRRSSSGNR